MLHTHFMPLGLTLARPAALLLLAAAAGPVWLARRAGRRGFRVSFLSAALQSAAAALAVLAIVGPAAEVGRGKPKPVLVFQDVSGSCRRQQGHPLDLPDGLAAERLAFASGVAGDAAGLEPNRTDIAPVLRLAAARADGIAGVVIQTDGRFADDWAAAARALVKTNLPVAVAAMDAPPADARMADFAARRAPDGRVELRVTVRANALVRRTLKVHAVGRAQPLINRVLDLRAGQPATITLTDSPPAGGRGVYRAQLVPPDTFPENDRAEAASLPTARRVAVIAPPKAGPLAAKIAASADLEGVTFDAVAPARANAAGADWWMGHSAVVLADAGGHLLAGPVRASLEAFVRSGGGLVLIGAGPHDAPADRDDPLNRAAALIANPYQRKPLRLIVVLDASGSMAEGASLAGRVKFDQAVEAVTSLRRHLTPDDSLAVIAFSDDANRVYDSGSSPPDFGAAGEALGAIRPGGSTDVGKALHLAVSRPVPAGRDGLVLVVSDLRTKTFDPLGMADAFRGRGLSLAVVALSSAGQTDTPAGAPLESLARLLKAPIVPGQADLSGLARVFANLLRRTRGNAVRRGGFAAAVVRPALDLSPGELPAVGAYLLSAPQPDAQVLAEVADEHDPLLAVRQVGLGRSVTLAMPATPADNPDWRSGPLADVAAAAVRWAIRPPADGRFTGQAWRQGRQCRMELEARDANGPVNGLKLVARVQSVTVGAASRPEGVAMDQTAPGRYAVAVADPGGPVAVEVSTADGRVLWQTVIPGAAPAEFAAVGADHASLRRLAELTGGRVVTSPQVAALGRRLVEVRQTALWPVLLAAAAALMLIDWAVSRVRRRA